MPSQLADELGIPSNTLSFHLSHLSKVGLLTSTKNGRSISYFANTELMNDLVSFLQESCCSREPVRGPRKASRKGSTC